jgi:hypothetical protein
MRELVASKIDFVDLVEYERQVGVLRSQLDENTFTLSWGDGYSLSMEQAVDFALGETKNLWQGIPATG